MTEQGDLELRRMDFVQRIISVDENSRTIEMVLEPDPRRYEWITIDGEQHLYDKLDDVYISRQAMRSLAEQLNGMPIYYQPQQIRDAEAYIDSRGPLIAGMLEGVENAPTFEDKSEEFLQQLEVDKLAFVIVSIDLVGSTRLAAATEPKTYARLISTVLFELSEVVPKFRGHVLKYTGDGLIAYFPEPSFITKNDLAIDCALTLHGLVYKGLNPAFEKRGLPTIGVRIGLEAGKAYVKTIGSPQTKQHKDIIGSVVSLAAKIQAQARSGEIFLGEIAERNMHTMWRQICEPVDLGTDWVYKNPRGNPYRVYRLKLAPSASE